MNIKLKSKKIIGLIGAFLFAFSMTINQLPPKVYASSIESTCNAPCTGWMADCNLKCEENTADDDQ